MPDHVNPVSDTVLAKNTKGNIADQLWKQYSALTKDDASIGIYFPLTNTDPIEIGINHRPGTYYNADYYHFDQYSGKELEATGTYAGSFDNSSMADKIKRMNYDIHVGAILGLPGKILAFFASLIAASLPVTGFYIWWGRKKKKARAAVEIQTRRELQTA